MREKEKRYKRKKRGFQKSGIERDRKTERKRKIERDRCEQQNGERGRDKVSFIEK